MRHSLTYKVKELASNLGADMVGIASQKSFSKAPHGHRPQDLLRDTKSVIVIAVSLPESSFESAPSREYSAAYLAANSELNRIAFHISKLLEKEGFRAIQIPAAMPYDYETDMGDLSHRHAANLAGLGNLGKNCLLLTERFGPRVRLVSVVTNAELSHDPRSDLDHCGSCTKCLDACPSGALSGPGIIDKKKCNEQHERVGKELGLSDEEQICGVCIKVCPVGKPID